METVEELKKYVRFLYASLQEKDRENLQMKKDMSEIKEELREANRRADEEAASRQRLFDKLEKFMDGQKSESDRFKELERKYETLQGRYDLLCAAYYGGSKTCSDKATNGAKEKQFSYILYNFSTCLKIRGVFQREAILPQHFHNNFNFCES